MIKKIILSTGVSGFIVQHFVTRLFKQGLDVCFLDNLSKQAHENDQLPKLLAQNTTFLKRDIRGRALFKEAPQGATYIVHFVAKKGTQYNS